jgi:hypothetical protein
MRHDPTLAYTVHHKGQVYRAGMTAEDIGPVAAEIGEHAWEDGIAPTPAPHVGSGSPVGDGVTPAGAPPAPPDLGAGAAGGDEPAASEGTAARRGGGRGRGSGAQN